MKKSLQIKKRYQNHKRKQTSKRKVQKRGNNNHRLIKNKNKNKKGGAPDDRDKCYVALLELLDNLEENDPEKNEEDKKGLFKYKEITESNLLYDKYQKLYGIYDDFSKGKNNKGTRDIYYIRKLLDYLVRCIKDKSDQDRIDEVTHDGIYIPEINDLYVSSN
mgnify:CR=1 FL=1